MAMYTCVCLCVSGVCCRWGGGGDLCVLGEGGGGSPVCAHFELIVCVLMHRLICAYV